MTRKTNIAVLLDIRHKAAYELTSGILRYAAAHRNWSVRLLGNHKTTGTDEIRTVGNRMVAFTGRQGKGDVARE